MLATVRGGERCREGAGALPAPARARSAPRRPAGRSRRSPRCRPPLPRRAMEDVLPSGLLEVCLLVGVPQERVRTLLQVRGSAGRAGGLGRARVSRWARAAACVGAVLCSEV